MRSVTNKQPKSTKMTFGDDNKSGKTEHNVEKKSVVIRHQTGITIPAGNPKNTY